MNGVGAFDLISRQAMLSGLRDGARERIDAIRQRILREPFHVFVEDGCRA